jgi:hypothetical protein
MGQSDLKPRLTNCWRFTSEPPVRANISEKLKTAASLNRARNCHVNLMSDEFNYIKDDPEFIVY